MFFIFIIFLVNIKHNDRQKNLLYRYNIINKSEQSEFVLRDEIAVSLPKILGIMDDYSQMGINGDHPLIMLYSDYTDFYSQYDDIVLGYIGFSVTVIYGIDEEKYGYPVALRPKDYLSKRDALEYLLKCVENENADKNKSIINRALHEKIIGLSDLISFADLDKPIDRKQYNKLMYNLLCHRRYLYLEKGNISIQHDLDSYSGTSITYKEYLDSIQSAMTDK